jgi:hypothetical protein
LLGWSLAGAAQSWCPPGATWWHSYGSIGGGSGYVNTIYHGDTVIDGLTCQRLQGAVHAWNIQDEVPITLPAATYHTTVVGDLVMVVQQGVLDTLFHFGAVPGDKWYVPDVPWSGSVPNYYTVTDTGSQVITGQLVHWWAVGVYMEMEGGSFLMWNDTLLERIGMRSLYLIPQLSLSLEPDIHGLRCYSDDQVAYNTGFAPSCAYIVGMSEQAMAHVVPFPNPAVDQVTIATPAAAWITVHDALGHVVWGGPATSERSTIPVAQLVPGLYTVAVRDGGLVATGRFIKH